MTTVLTAVVVIVFFPLSACSSRSVLCTWCPPLPWHGSGFWKGCPSEQASLVTQCCLPAAARHRPKFTPSEQTVQEDRARLAGESLVACFCLGNLPEILIPVDVFGSMLSMASWCFALISPRQVELRPPHVCRKVWARSHCHRRSMSLRTPKARYP